MHSNSFMVIYVFFLFAFLQTAWAQNQSLYVVENNGEQTAYEISAIGKLYFDVGQLFIQQANGLESNYSLTDLRLLSFIDVVAAPYVRAEAVTQLRLYPIPASDYINVDYYSLLAETVTLNLLSVDGRQVYRQVVNCSKGINSISIGLANMPSGLKICQIQGSAVFVIQKFIKQ